MTPHFGLIIIGDEILSGKRADKHLPKTIELLQARGLPLAWAEYVGDSPGRIEAAFDIAQRDFFPKPLTARCASDPAGLFTLVGCAGEFHSWQKRRIVQRNQAAQSLVRLAGHLDS